MEFFPPKTEQGERNFFDKTVPGLNALKPDYCSVTYGAGGSTRQKTLSIVDRIQREHSLVVFHHPFQKGRQERPTKFPRPDYRTGLTGARRYP